MSKKRPSVRFPQSWQIRRLLGLNPYKLPREQEERWFYFMGLRFHLCPPLTVNRHGKKTRCAHRLQVECNVCKRWMSCGHFNQHQGTHPREQLSELSKKFLNDAEFWGKLQLMSKNPLNAPRE